MWLLLNEFKETLQPQRKHFHLSPFVPDDGSKAAVYCFSIYINTNGMIVSVHTNVTNTVNMWFRLNLRSNKSARSSRRDISPIRAGRIVWTCSGFSGQETSSLFQPDRQNGARLYLREVIPLMYKTPKQSFLPPHFPGAIPFKKARPFMLAHMHTRDQKQNKQTPFKYQPTCLPFDWRSYCTARPGLVQRAAVTCSALWAMDADPTELQQLSNNCGGHVCSYTMNWDTI